MPSKLISPTNPPLHSCARRERLPQRAVVSVSGLCRLLKMSRSQFYVHAKRGTFHAPLYLATTNRPFFTAAMVEDNVRARETGVGVNGEYVLFYERLPTDQKPEVEPPKTNHASLLEGLASFGLKEVTKAQLEGAMKTCFPAGTNGEDEVAVLRAVFRHLKRAGVG